MANQEKYAQQMQDAGVCDARGAALCATVKELPDGSFGMVLLGVKALFVRGGKFPEGHSHDLKEIARKKK